MKGCDTRKLSSLYCEPEEEKNFSTWLSNEASLFQVLIIPATTLQGYLFWGESVQELSEGVVNLNKENLRYRFRLPGIIQERNSFWIAKNKENNPNCCDTGHFSIVTSTQKGMYTSSLHQIKNVSEMMKDVKEILIGKDYDISFRNFSRRRKITGVMGRSRGKQNKIFKGFIKIRVRGSFTDLTLWETLNTNDQTKKRYTVFIENFFGLEGKATALLSTQMGFNILQENLAALYYSQKTIDVLGD